MTAYDDALALLLRTADALRDAARHAGGDRMALHQLELGILGGETVELDGGSGCAAAHLGAVGQILRGAARAYVEGYTLDGDLVRAARAEHEDSTSYRVCWALGGVTWVHWGPEGDRYAHAYERAMGADMWRRLSPLEVQQRLEEADDEVDAPHPQAGRIVAARAGDVTCHDAGPSLADFEGDPSPQSHAKGTETHATKPARGARLAVEGAAETHARTHDPAGFAADIRAMTDSPEDRRRYALRLLRSGLEVKARASKRGQAACELCAGPVEPGAQALRPKPTSRRRVHARCVAGALRGWPMGLSAEESAWVTRHAVPERDPEEAADVPELGPGASSDDAADASALLSLLPDDATTEDW